jgi:hypothetical protein
MGTGALAVNRARLRKLADDRLRDARVLLKAKRWAGAYYLAGYAVECALKACVLHHLQKTGKLFEDRKYLRDLGECWTHNFDRLVELADLASSLGVATGANADLKRHWELVRAWKETSRYERRSRVEARSL